MYTQFSRLALVLALALGSFAASAVAHSINLVSSIYNAPSDSTTFTYSVTSGQQPAISHWVLEFSGPCGAPSSIAANEASVAWTDDDPKTGVRGVKFDLGYGDNQTRIVTLTLGGQWATGVVNYAIKAGNIDPVFGTVQGPVCVSSGPVLVSYTVSGTVFFDSNYSSAREPAELGLSGYTVTLLDSAAATVATTTSAANGSYSFTVFPGSYTIVVSGAPTGLSLTTNDTHDVTVSNANISAPDTGYAINYSAISGMTANGNTIGFWKNNLEKAAAGKTNGVQVSAATLLNYTAQVKALALEPFANLTDLKSAAAVMSATGSAPTVLLQKQLLASEYNYANGACLNGNATLTYLFVYQGEYVLEHAANYSSSYLLWLKDWFDAYNNSHGGAVIGPVAP